MALEEAWAPILDTGELLWQKKGIVEQPVVPVAFDVAVLVRVGPGAGEFLTAMAVD